MKTIDEIKAVVYEAFLGVSVKRDALTVKLQEAIASNTMIHWAEWNFEEYMEIEQAFIQWKEIKVGLDRMIAEGRTAEEILQLLKGYRESLVVRIMNSVRGGSNSTNTVKNLLGNIENCVLAKVAGINFIDSYSLYSLDSK